MCPSKQHPKGDFQEYQQMKRALAEKDALIFHLKRRMRELQQEAILSDQVFE